ncbi:uncharacterized protein LOC131037578 [Cryptomeria japonica]|uniref:uncharacterized protein LOC131037578 n=1 Tax=Cryptomeria japonica TaxID=3369 RepID=UPI0025AC6A4B|nr:uncharacterized protein LOC131037578 [Cryptomeria japonica]
MEHRNYESEGVVDTEGELRSSFADLDERRFKLKKVKDKVAHLRNLLGEETKQMGDLDTNLNGKTDDCTKLEKEVRKLIKELKEAKEQIEKGLKLKGGSEVLDVVLNAKKQRKDKEGLGYEKGECSKGKEKINDPLVLNVRKSPLVSNRYTLKAYCFTCNEYGYQASECRSQVRSQSNVIRCYSCDKIGHKENVCRTRMTWNGYRNTNFGQSFHGKCYSCNKYGHKAFECRTSNRSENTRRYGSYQQRDLVYYSCSKVGHVARDCRSKFNMSSRPTRKVDVNLEKEKMKKMRVKKFDEKIEKNTWVVLAPTDGVAPSRNKLVCWTKGER